MLTYANHMLAPVLDLKYWHEIDIDLVLQKKNNKCIWYLTKVLFQHSFLPPVILDDLHRLLC